MRPALALGREAAGPPGGPAPAGGGSGPGRRRRDAHPSRSPPRRMGGVRGSDAAADQAGDEEGLARIAHGSTWALEMAGEFERGLGVARRALDVAIENGSGVPPGRLPARGGDRVPGRARSMAGGRRPRPTGRRAADRQPGDGVGGGDGDADQDLPRRVRGGQPDPRPDAGYPGDRPQLRLGDRGARPPRLCRGAVRRRSPDGRHGPSRRARRPTTRRSGGCSARPSAARPTPRRRREPTDAGRRSRRP